MKSVERRFVNGEREVDRSIETDESINRWMKE